MSIAGVTPLGGLWAKFPFLCNNKNNQQEVNLGFWGLGAVVYKCKF